MKAILWLFLAAALPLCGDIHYSDDIESILAEADRDTLVVLDIWETVMLPAQWLGGPRSRQELISSFEKQGLYRDEARERTEQILDRAHRSMKVVPVEENTALHVCNVQNRGVHVIGQTCDPSTRGYLTGDQLALLGIDLKRTAIPQFDVELEEGDYMEGILFVRKEEKKGSSLVALLEKMDRHPTRVLFIDNEEEHVKDVHRELSLYDGIDEVDAYVYNKAKYWERGYSQDVVDVQAHYLGRILSDEEANKLIDARIES